MSRDPFAYGGYHGHGGYPGGYGPMVHYNQAARLRTISRSLWRSANQRHHRLAWLPRRRSRCSCAANGYVPRKISAAGESGELFEGQAHGSNILNIIEDRSIGEENESVSTSRSASTRHQPESTTFRTCALISNLTPSPSPLLSNQPSPVFPRLATLQSLGAAGMRIDFQFNTDVGYAFVNFIDPMDIIDFVNAFVNKEWQPGYRPRKIAQVAYATVQGIGLVEKFRNSAMMQEFSDYRPKLWY
ncbi:Meiosis protein mei2 [Pseudocercospora fuligena]|uniref:Meiosis protein mei2 n=1 Tax=Pseudocercospora fuligena TaxID=685502 RepID=A0A8H6VH21_9PEZI|nr:Meiosis protein mei2 [Pseudocercospora fuligena]